ncbi:MAG TPA: class I SAM-dependent methyltransferase, partial [Actinomycetes bacterium]|nr:class I SAM-dependent methyltransferase [Actinomycetes bacterium]
MTTTIGTADADEGGRRDALADRLLKSMIGSFELAGVWLGLRLQLYEALRDQGPATVAELAERAGIDARYAREWLEQQAVAGLLDVEDAAADAQARRYRLPEAHADVLLDADHPAHAGATAYWIGSLAEVLHRVPGIYRSGEGLPYPEYGADCRLAIANFNRPMFVNDLADWFAAAPELQARLAADGARVLDAGCGIGWSSISLARAFPALRVDGIDSDDASIAEARRLADEAGVADRVRFRVVDAAELGAAGEGGYAAAFVFEALHDMARPVEALAAIRALLADGRVVIVADEKVAETFTAPGDEVERLNYGFSWWHCLPASRAETPSAANGTALRPDTVPRLGRPGRLRRLPGAARRQRLLALLPADRLRRQPAGPAGPASAD